MNCLNNQLLSIHRHLVNNRALYSSLRAIKEQRIVHTNESDPRNHTEDHLGLFYRIPDEVFDRVFKLAGFLYKQNEFMSLIKDRSVMIRKPALDIMNYLKRTDFSKPANKYVIYGKNGYGKTYILNHVLHYAHLEQFMLIHLDWNASRWFVCPKGTEVSERNSSRIDFPTNSAIWLQQFRTQNAALLLSSNLTTTKKYEWSLRESTEAGEPLTNVIEHGLARIKHASDCVAVLLKELEIAANSGKCKILYAVDIANCFYRLPNIKYPDKVTPVIVDNTTIGRAFKKLFKSKWKNAAVVAVVDTRPYLTSTDQPPVWKWKERTVYPLDLLTYEGFNDFDPFLPIRVDKLSEKEAEAMLDYLRECNFLCRRESLTEEGRAELKFMSAYNPGELVNLCAPY